VKIYEPTTEELQLFQDAVKPVWSKVEEKMGTDAFNALVTFVENYTASRAK
jgi:hypothetical protein